MRRRTTATKSVPKQLTLDQLQPMLPGGDLRVRGITADPAEVAEGVLFVQTADDAAAVERAVQSGAAAIVSERESTPGCPIPWFRVQDALRVLGHVASRLAAEPSTRLEVSVFCGDAHRRDVRRMAGLLHARDDGALTGVGLAREAGSLGSALLHRKLAQHAAAHGRSVLLECRGTDLRSGRLEGVNLAAVVPCFSGTVQCEEADAARVLVGMLPEKGVVVLDATHPLTAQLTAATNAVVITWALEAEADVRATLLSRDRKGVRLQLQTPVGAAELELAVLDEASVRAAIAAFTHAVVMGMAPDRAAARLHRTAESSEALRRMPLPADFDVWTTRAQSRGGLARALRTVQSFTKGRVLLVPPVGFIAPLPREDLMHGTLDAAVRGDGVLIALDGEDDLATLHDWFLRGLTDVA